MKQNELVSIITPSYNTGMFIAETINTVLAQTYKNWEMIIIDDCSTDNTDQIVAEFRDPRIKYFKNEKNSGAAISRNKALRKAKGKWIAFLDSDDLWTSDKLARQIHFMRKYDLHFTYSMYEEIDEKSKSLGRVVSGPHKINRTLMYAYCWPGCLTVMYNAEKIGLIQIADIKKNNDYAMWIKICKKEDCYFIPRVLARYRKRTGSISNHNYIKLIKHHYILWKNSENQIRIKAILLTIVNLLFGVVKKIIFIKGL